MSATLTLHPSMARDLLPDVHQKQDNLAWSPVASKWAPHCHPRVEQVSESVNSHFLRYWPFPDERAKAKFNGADFPRVTCLYFPLARDDRIEHACVLLTILFLVDGMSYFHSKSSSTNEVQMSLSVCLSKKAQRTTSA